LGGFFRASTEARSSTITSVTSFFLSLFSREVSPKGGHFFHTQRLKAYIVTFSDHLLSIELSHPLVIQFTLDKYKVRSNQHLDCVRSWASENGIVCHRDIHNEKVYLNGS